MKKKLLLCMFLASGLCMQGQVIVNLQLPPLGLTIKPQLWNLSLINTTADNIDVRIELVMTDVSNNQRVLTATSNLLTLPKGVKQLQPPDVMPVTYNMGSPGYGVDPNPNGFLPTGVFTLCYSVIKIYSDAPERMAEECITQEVEPISPPQLMIPAEHEQVEITRPLFAWAPPSPFNSYAGLLYDWILVEVQPTQSAADAIQQNIPVLTRQNISYTSFQYPLSSPELDTNKLYAWRITAKNNTSPIANSETWRFRIGRFGADTAALTNKGYYCKLRRQDDAAYLICNGVLHYEYFNEINNNTVTIQLTDISTANQKRVQTDSVNYTMKYGQNFVDLDLHKNKDMINRHMYLLTLTDARNERWYLRFEYRK